MPKTSQEWLQIAVKFDQEWNFPHCIGALDGKHVVIQKPIGSGSEFYNYKSFFSIVLFAMVDAEYNFVFADVGCQGRISDGGVFRNCQLFQKLEDETLNLPPAGNLPGRRKPVPYTILGDEAFALDEHLMKPYAGVHQKGTMKRIFNYRLSRARRVVENAFGILSSVFRVLRKPLLLQPDKAEVVVMASICLHNFLRRNETSRNIYSPQGTFDTEENGQIIPGNWRNDVEMSSLLNIQRIPRKSSKRAQEIREELSNFFMENGSISWQNDYA